MELVLLQTTDTYYREALRLRFDLFFKEHGLPWSILFDAHENRSHHLGLIEGGALHAYGRLCKIAEEYYQVSQMVVAPTSQGIGLGTRILHQLLRIATENGATEIVLHARLPAVAMYQKAGFQVQGATYESQSTGVRHLKMVKIMGESCSEFV